MDISCLTDFVELSQCSSFSDAARRLNKTQSALSKRIKSMEGELGETLIDRNAAAIQLTPAGETFLHAAIDIVNRYNQMVNDVHRASSLPTVNVGGMLHDTLVMQVFNRLQTQDNAPYLINFINQPFDIISHPISHGELDIFFAAIGSDNALNGQEYEFYPVDSERVWAAMATSHELADRKLIYVDDLRTQTLVRLVSGHSTDDGWRQIEGMCKRAGFLPSFVLARPERTNINFKGGIYLMPESKVADIEAAVPPGTISCVPLEEAVSFDLYMITRAHPDRRGVTQCREDIKRALEELRAQN